MNKKLVVAAALIFGAAGLFLAGSVKAQDAAPADNSATNTDAGAAMNADNAAAPAAPAAQ